MLKKIVFLGVCFFAACGAFCQKVISPIEGSFNNKQPLVINLSDDEECYYSFTDSDPLTSGFIYDGPILIEEEGDVKVKIVCIKGEDRQEYEIDYNVKDSASNIAVSDSLNEKDYFLLNVVSHGIYQWSSEYPLSIPSDFVYSFGNDDAPFISGVHLSLHQDNNLARYLPCNVSDGKDNWRFVIQVDCERGGVLSQAEFPFKIVDWDTFYFTGEKLIYSIDDEMWNASPLPVKLDRSKSHIIRWQDVAYEFGNPVSSFELPVMPSIQKVSPKTEKDAIEFKINGDERYKMSLISCGVSGEFSDKKGLFDNCVIDVFVGDEISGEAVFTIYCDGLYQGKLSAPVALDRQPPHAPEFETEQVGDYARSSVNLKILSKSNGEIFYAVSAPYFIDAQDVVGEDFKYPQVETQNFRKYDKPVRLLAGKSGAVYYNVKAYVIDDMQNISSISEYNVIIDEYNYYIDSTREDSLCDGSKINPFTDFTQAIAVINRTKFVHFYIKGTFTLNNGETLINSNCAFTPIGETRIIIASDSNIIIRGAGFEAENIVFEKERGSNSTPVIFTLENATANFNNCEIVGVFDGSGTAFACKSSVLNLTESGVTVQGDVYSCAVNANDSKINARTSRFTTIAPTSVNFSVASGTFDLHSSNCSVNGNLGRIAELTGTTAKIGFNTFNGEFSKKIKNLVPVWNDDKTVFLENQKNKILGF